MYREASHRADERGDTDGAVNLGLLLYERGDLEGAEAASRRTDERGNAAAAHNLGLLLKQRRDLEGADPPFAAPTSWRHRTRPSGTTGISSAGWDIRSDSRNAEGSSVREGQFSPRPALPLPCGSGLLTPG
jgi:hypothetical protein